ncbi:MAG: beta-galactosidase [Candidatus Doudnabacteria bacterium]|nr:beta-galactosidase [Candidatus Doudnabacteria bacterium]
MKMHRGLKIISILLALAAVVPYLVFRPAPRPVWGVNFSIPQATYLGFEWQKLYLDILDELDAKRLRVMAYWELVEPSQGGFDFSAMDFILEEARRRGVRIMLVLGHKQPRWPECHEPGWARNLESKTKHQELLEYIEAVVKRYKDHPAIAAWQVENEPLFPFGPDCGRIPFGVYREEVALVKSLDSRPIVVTDSGEKGAWLPTTWAGGEIFGATMYREIYHDKLGRYIKYPIPPALYRWKAGWLWLFSGVSGIIGVELQAEPWFATDVYRTPWERQRELMNGEKFLENVAYARRVGFAENYFWGVEWWYYARQVKGDAEIWNLAKKLLAE